MTEIICKAKRKDNGHWILGQVVYDKTFGGKPDEHTYIVDHEHPSGCFGNDIFVEVYPETVCLFSGLTDIQNYMLFEGGFGVFKEDYADYCLKDKKELQQNIYYSHGSFSCCGASDGWIATDNFGLASHNFILMGNIHDGFGLSGGWVSSKWKQQ